MSRRKTDDDFRNRCVACDQLIGNDQDHHCDERRTARRDQVMSQERDWTVGNRNYDLTDRLSHGFAMLEEDDNGD